MAHAQRLLASGPRTGLAEIELPPVQPGSSIMPGKVNPVLAEMLNMVCYHVIGNDTTVAPAQKYYAKDLPQRAYDPDKAAFHFKKAGMANADLTLEVSEKSLSLITALNPHVGYARAAEIAKEMLKSRRGAREVTREMNLLDDAKLDEVLNLEGMTGPEIHTGEEE